MATMDYENENGRYDGTFVTSSNFNRLVTQRPLFFDAKGYMG